MVKNTKTQSAPVESKENPQRRVALTPELANNLFNAEKKRYDAIVNDKAKIQRMIFDTEKTIFSLEELSKNTNDSLQVNLGSGVYLDAKVVDKKNVKFMIGSDVFLQKTSAEVIDTLKTKKAGLTKDFENLSKLESQSQTNLNQLYSYLVNVSKKSKQ